MGAIEYSEIKIDSWRPLGSKLTFALLLIYITILILKFQIPWLLVRVQIAIFVLLCFRVLGGLRSIRMTRTQLLTIIVLGLTLCATIAGQLVSEQGSNLRMIPQVSRFLFITIASVIELNSVKRLRTTLAWTTAIAAAVGMLTIVNVLVPLPFAFTGPTRSLGLLPLSLPRSLGIWMSFGSYGILAAVGVTYAGVVSIWPTALRSDTSRWYRRLLAASALLIILVSVYLGKSRSTWLAVVMIIGWFFAVAAFHPDERFRTARPAIRRGLLLLAVLGTGVASKSIFHSFLMANTKSIASRTEQYELAIELLAQRPLLGWGWNYFTVAFSPGFHVHNLWFQIGVSLGIPIFLLWIYLFGRLGIGIFRRNRAEDSHIRSLAVVGTGMLLGGMVELALYPGFTPVTAVLIGLLIGIVGLSGNRRYPVDE